MYEYCDDYYYYEETYTKGHLHVMVWTALWQWAVPMIAFEQYESKAYLDYYNVSAKPSGGATNKDHYTRLVMAWE